MAAEAISFDGPCPFLTCFEAGAHTHLVCEVCGAVRYGNLSCPTCREHIEERAASVEAGLGARGLP